jgi:hypothetical protein
LKLPNNAFLMVAIGGIVLAAAIVLVVYVSANSTGDPAGAPERAIETGTPPAVGATVTSESPLPTTVAGSRTLSIPAGMNGFIAIDPLTADVTPIWLGAENMSDYPTLTTSRDAIWLFRDNASEESVRFDLAGREVDRVPGTFPDESPNGKVVLYSRLTAEGERHLVARYAYRTVDLGEGGTAAVSEGGRIAFLGASVDEGPPLLMYDPATGTTWTVAEHIGPSLKAFPYPVWSPSGRFLSGRSFDSTTGQSTWILADTTTRRVDQTTLDCPGSPDRTAKIG